MNKSNGYSNIFKATFLFAIVRVVLILNKIILNKFISVFMGPSGFGLIGIYQSTINLISTISSFGIYQSAIRDIAEVNESKDELKISKLITLTNNLIFYTALFGLLLTIIFSSYFSMWSFGSKQFQFSIILLSLAVFFQILTEGQLSILKGKRLLKSLAKANIYGSIFSLLICLPVYYFYGNRGIVPSLVMIALILFLFSNYFVNKIDYKKLKLSFSYCIKEGSQIVKMGLSLMYVSLTLILCDYLIKAFILNFSNIEMVGFFQAGSTIVGGYFLVFTNAMTTEYYPRISSFNHDNHKLSQEVNKQSLVGLVLLGPLVVIFLFFMPYLIKLLFSAKFLVSINYITYAILAVIILSCSNTMSMVLLAKQNSKIFLFTVTISRSILIVSSYYGYQYYGLNGLGFAYLLYSICDIFIMQITLSYFFKIYLKLTTILILLKNLILCILTLATLSIPSLEIRWAIGLLLVLISGLHSFRVVKNNMKIDLLKILKEKINK